MILILTLAPAVAHTEDGRLLVRLRGVHIAPADKSDAIPALGVPSDAIQVSSKTIPEVDVTYFLTRNVAAELVLTYPQKHDVDLSGTKLGSFKHLPPVLSLQYHFVPGGTFRPYLGVGVNLTLISAVDLAVPGVGALDLEGSSVGLSGQAGFDLKVGDKLFLNGDLKYVTLRSDVTLAAGGQKVSAVQIDPWLISVGLGYRF
jgi:outer membrane protein